MLETITKRWMKPVHTKTGKVVMARPHQATFKGLHNSSKSKAFIVLYHRMSKLRQTTGLSLAELAEASGVGYNYLGSRVAKWVGWGYLLRKVKQGTNKPVYSYVIAERGIHFVKDRIPRDRLQDYIAEIRAHKATNNSVE